MKNSNVTKLVGTQFSCFQFKALILGLKMKGDNKEKLNLYENQRLLPPNSGKLLILIMTNSNPTSITKNIY
ncbi:MAG: hypothetical protein KPI85_03630 [cyanobacterium endosymbiont of Epithemia adnata isolate EadnSB Bon19]